MAESNLSLFRFTDPRQRRIYDKLFLVGPGPAVSYLDACKLMDAASNFETASHIIAHSFREIESALRAVLLPYNFSPPKAGSENHKQQIRAILQEYQLEESDPAAEFWLKLADQNEAIGLARLAHRNELASPRAVDEDFRKICDDIESFEV